VLAKFHVRISFKATCRNEIPSRPEHFSFFGGYHGDDRLFDMLENFAFSRDENEEVEVLR
jgi:hypothetical protein